MSETSEERTKRQYLAVHRSEQWTYKHSIFYEHPEDSKALLDHMVKFKQLLRRRCSDQPFLIRIQTRLLPYKPLQAFLILYTTAKVENLQEIANKAFPAAMNVWGSKLPYWKLEQTATTIEKYAPHNPNKFFGKPSVKRWSVLNKEKLVITG